MLHRRDPIPKAHGHLCIVNDLNMHKVNFTLISATRCKSCSTGNLVSISMMPLYAGV